MASPSERRAVFWLLALGATGLVARVAFHQAGAPGAIAYQAPPARRDALDSVAERARRGATPLTRGERVDLDRASGEEIARLPRIGPGLAGRIVADREARGPFGSLSGLDRVPGIGPSVLDAVKPHAAFSGRPAVISQAAELPSHRTGGPVSLSTATAAQLAQVSGIGPAKAAAIIEFRRRRGPFRAVRELDSVPGFGPALVRRAAPFLVP
jgi:competence ComEA-like helix-hairpin-helix protein